MKTASEIELGANVI